MKHDFRLDDALPEILQRKGVIRPKSHGECEEENNTDDHQDDQTYKHAEAPQEPGHQRAGSHADQTGNWFARNRNVRILFQIIPLNKKDNQRGDYQEDR